MDWLTLVSNVISHLAWPCTVLICLYMLKDKLTNILPYIKNLKYKDFELEMSNQSFSIENDLQLSVNSLKDEEKLSVEVDTDSDVDTDVEKKPDVIESNHPTDEIEKSSIKKSKNKRNQFAELLSISPKAAVLLAWAELRKELVNFNKSLCKYYDDKTIVINNTDYRSSRNLLPLIDTLDYIKLSSNLVLNECIGEHEYKAILKMGETVAKLEQKDGIEISRGLGEKYVMFMLFVERDLLTKRSDMLRTRLNQEKQLDLNFETNEEKAE